MMVEVEKLEETMVVQIVEGDILVHEMET